MNIHDATEQAYKKGYEDGKRDAVEHGWWDDTGRYLFGNGRKAICCSICGCALSEEEYHQYNWNYCPVCGAKMDGDVNG